MLIFGKRFGSNHHPDDDGVLSNGAARVARMLGSRSDGPDRAGPRGVDTDPVRRRR